MASPASPLADPALGVGAKLAAAHGMLDAATVPMCERAVFDWLASTLHRSIKGTAANRPADAASPARAAPAHAAPAYALPGAWMLLARLAEPPALDRLQGAISSSARLLLTAAARALEACVPGAHACSPPRDGAPARADGGGGAPLAESEAAAVRVALLDALDGALSRLFSARCALCFRPPLTSLCAFAETALDVAASARAAAEAADVALAGADVKAGVARSVDAASLAMAAAAAELSAARIAACALVAVAAATEHAPTQRVIFAAVCAHLLRPCLAVLAHAHAATEERPGGDAGEDALAVGCPLAPPLEAVGAVADAAARHGWRAVGALARAAVVASEEYADADADADGDGDGTRDGGSGGGGGGEGGTCGGGGEGGTCKDERARLHAQRGAQPQPPTRVTGAQRRRALGALARLCAARLGAVLCHPEHIHAYAQLLGANGGASGGGVGGERGGPNGEARALAGHAVSSAREGESGRVAAPAASNSDSVAARAVPRAGGAEKGAAAAAALSYERVLPEALDALAADADAADFGAADFAVVACGGAVRATRAAAPRDGRRGGSGARADGAGARDARTGGGVHGGLCCVVEWFTLAEASRRALHVALRAQRDGALGAASASMAAEPSAKRRRHAAGGAAGAADASGAASAPSLAFAMLDKTLGMCEARLALALHALSTRGAARVVDARAKGESAVRAAAACAGALVACARLLRAAARPVPLARALEHAAAAGVDCGGWAGAAALAGAAGGGLAACAYEPHSDRGGAQLERVRAHARAASRAAEWWRWHVTRARDDDGDDDDDDGALAALVGAALCAHAHALSSLCPAAIDAPPTLRTTIALVDASAHGRARASGVRARRGCTLNEAGRAALPPLARRAARALGEELLRNFGARRMLPALCSQLLVEAGGSFPETSGRVVSGVAAAGAGARGSEGASPMSAGACLSGLSWLFAALPRELRAAPRAQAKALCAAVQRAIGAGDADGVDDAPALFADVRGDGCGGNGGDHDGACASLCDLAARAPRASAREALRCAAQAVVGTAIVDGLALDAANCAHVGAASARLLPRVARAHDALARAAMDAAAAVRDGDATAEAAGSADASARAAALGAAWAACAQLWRAAHDALRCAEQLGYALPRAPAGAAGAVVSRAAADAIVKTTRRDPAAACVGAHSAPCASLRAVLDATAPRALDNGAWPCSRLVCDGFDVAVRAVFGAAHAESAPARTGHSGARTGQSGGLRSAGDAQGAREAEPLARAGGVLAVGLAQLAARRASALSVTRSCARAQQQQPPPPGAPPPRAPRASSLDAAHAHAHVEADADVEVDAEAEAEAEAEGGGGGGGGGGSGGGGGGGCGAGGALRSSPRARGGQRGRPVAVGARGAGGDDDDGGEAREALAVRVALLDVATSSLHVWLPLAPRGALASFNETVARAAVAPPPPAPTAARARSARAGPTRAAHTSARDVTLSFLCDASLAELPDAHAAATRALIALLGRTGVSALRGAGVADAHGGGGDGGDDGGLVRVVRAALGLCRRLARPLADDERVEPGVHALIGACEPPQLNFLFGALDDAGKERFRELHEAYARDGKFGGRV
ncbi:hypothetical protein KFE25_004514 [Diacronema lutheri]|uniref:Uncharacterized protein n=1 Tax=Diacronema lutheri TaxID=2081491 RepID=A0A8J5X3D5_DIALT|nr:hypothetical protein KFE25_004514 [Diacronema lutheri]